MRRALAIASFLLLAPFTPASTEGETPDTLTNRTCPVMIGTPVDAEKWVDHEGERIYFCCDRCIRRFRENPEFYLAPLEAEEASAATDLYPEWDGGALTGRLVRFLGNLHPLAVHFPIAFAFGALLADLLSLVRGEERYREAARFLLLVGAFSVVAALPLGYAAASGTAFPPETAPDFGSHRLLGTVGGALLLAAFGLREWSVRSPRHGVAGASRITLLLAAALIVLAGYHGGVLVHGHEHFHW